MWQTRGVPREILNTTQSRQLLVVGGAGYVGSVLTARLLRSGFRVKVLDSFIWSQWDSLLGFADDPRFQLVVGDMRDAATVQNALTDVTDVILLAGLVGDPITHQYPEESKLANLDGVRQVIQSCLAKEVKQLIFASTCSNYGLVPDGVIADENTPLEPLSLYAEHKVQIEQELLSVGGIVETDITVLRFATAFGLSPRMRLDLTISHFACDAVREGELQIYDADTWRPYCHVSDLSDAVRLVLMSEGQDTRGEVFNVGSHQNNYTKRMLGELYARSVPRLSIKFDENGGDTRNYRVSFEKIEERLGFKARVMVVDHVPVLVKAMKDGIVPMSTLGNSQFGNFTLRDRA